jgi:hypothetical protein
MSEDPSFLKRKTGRPKGIPRHPNSGRKAGVPN